MANFSGNLPATRSNTIATFGEAFSDMLADIGLVKEADSGTVDWGSASMPGTNGSYPYYEIWRFPDSSTQTNSPFYFKVLYGRGGTVSGIPFIGVKFIVGDSWVDGGTVNSISSTEYVLLPAAWADTSETYVAACDGHGFYITGGYNGSSNTRFVFVVDRPRTPSNGNPVEDSLYIYLDTANANIGTHVTLDYVANEARGVNSGNAPCVTPGLSNSNPMTNIVGQTQVYPWWSVTRNRRGILKMIASYSAGDLAANISGAGTHDVEFLGANRVYKAAGTLLTLLVDIWGTTSPDGSVLLWWSD